jgi:glycosyltransferase involved in cell wall biosynthesis
MLLVETLRCANRQRFEYAYGYFVPWKNALASRLEQEECQVFCFGGGNAASILMRATRVAACVSAWGAQIIHCHLPLAGVVGRVAGRIARVPVVYTEHNKLERYHALTRRLNIATWGLQAQAIAVSSAVECSIRKFITSPVPLRVLVNGVDTVRFDRERLSGSEDVRRQLGIPRKAPIIGTVAVFRKQKRLEDWIEAARMIRESHPGTVFVLVGGGPLEQDVRRWVARSGLGDAVRFAGLREDVRPILALMDVFMMSSIFEGLPVALLEAMAMQCPVVATAVGGIPEVVEHERTGLLVDPGNPGQLAAAARELLDKPDKRAELGHAGRMVVEEHFGLGRMAADVEAVYMEVLAARQRAD